MIFFDVVFRKMYGGLRGLLAEGLLVVLLVW